MLSIFLLLNQVSVEQVFLVFVVVVVGLLVLVAELGEGGWVGELGGFFEDFYGFLLRLLG